MKCVLVKVAFDPSLSAELSPSERFSGTGILHPFNLEKIVLNYMQDDNERIRIPHECVCMLYPAREWDFSNTYIFQILTASHCEHDRVLGWVNKAIMHALSNFSGITALHYKAGILTSLEMWYQFDNN